MMATLGSRVKVAISKALFDERFYRRAHPDVDHAIRVGALDSGFTHYEAYGRNEKRAIRRKLLPGVSAPTVICVFRGDGDYLSGAKIKLLETPAFAYRLRIYRLGQPVAERVVDIEIDGEAELGGGRGYVMWDPVTTAKGRMFFARMTRLSSDRTPLGRAKFLFESQEFSAPEAPTANPKLVVMSPITQCNLNCIHCISRPTRKQAREISTEVWSTFQNLAATGQLDHMSADYSGDILYAQGRTPSKWLDRLIDLDIPLRFDTHANNLNDENAQKLLDSKLAGLNFSIDSFDPVDYPKIRKGAGPLEQVLGNVARFMALRNRLRPTLPTTLSLVMMRRNLSSMIPAIDFAAEHKIDVVSISHVMVFTPDMTEQSCMLDLAGYRAAYDAANAHAQRKGVGFVAPLPITKRKGRKGHEPCEFPWVGVMITGEGNVNACCMPGSVVGNLNEQPLEEIWNGERMRGFRAQVNTPDPPKPCDACGVYRHDNNFETYVPGLSKPEREAFVARVLAQLQ